MSIVESGMTAIANIGTSLAAKAASATYQEANAKSLSEYSKELQLVPTFAIEKERSRSSRRSGPPCARPAQ